METLLLEDRVFTNVKRGGAFGAAADATFCWTITETVSISVERESTASDGIA